MSSATEIIRRAEAEICRPWLRHILSQSDWSAFLPAAHAQAWTLLAHWADTIQAHGLFLDPDAQSIVPVSTPIGAGRYPALSPIYPGAAWYERMIHDLWGHQAEGAIDSRPWLDHGAWPLTPPMAVRPEATRPGAPPRLANPEPTDFMSLPLGPVWGRLDEAAHLHLTLDGANILRAEALLGFTHKGTLTLMRGKSPRAAARFAARLSGDATVAHAVAFARATEAAMDVDAPPRALGLRIVMAEIERVAVHLDNLAEVGRLAESEAVHTQCGVLRENLLQACDHAFGHRLMMDYTVPGGVAVDIAADGPQAILRALGSIASAVPGIVRLHDAPALASRLTGLGRASAALVGALGAGGVVARASGRGFDLRADFATAHPLLRSRVATRIDGDAAARQHLRLHEIEESLRLIGVALEMLPAGPISVALPQTSGEGIGCAESARGDIWHWIRLDHGQIAAIFPRDPGWALWPLAERVMQQVAPEEVDLVRASFALPTSGMDL